MMARALAVLVAGLLFPLIANAEPLRIATFNAEMFRKGPGVLLRDIVRGKDPGIAAAADVIARNAPDILALQGFDWDHDGAALTAFAALLETRGLAYPHRFAARPNAGMATDLDLDGDGRLGGPGDAQGFGTFSGQGGIAVLSRHPIAESEVQDFSSLLWRDFPGALLPVHPDGRPYPSDTAQAIQRLSSTAHWAVPIDLPGGGRLVLLTFQAGPPVFDGPEDQNGRRNHDEVLFWRHYLDGAFGPAPQGPFVLAGGANLDPRDSDGRREAINALLTDPRLQDPTPASSGGNDATDTVDWPKVGQLRVDYVLPSADLKVTGAGVFWPAPGAPGHEAALAASRHRLVWVDLAIQ